MRWLQQGGVLVAFPAGEVARVELAMPVIADPEWHREIESVAKHSRARILPVYVSGANSAAFHIASLLHPLIRTAMLPAEF